MRLGIGVVGVGHFGRFHALKVAASDRARLVGVFDVYGAKGDPSGSPRVNMSCELRARDGAVVAQLPPTAPIASAGGALAHRFEVPLTGVAAGEYELVLQVEDTVAGTRLERREVIFVDPA